MTIRNEQAFMQEMLPEAKAKREAALKRLAEDGQQIESDTAGPVAWRVRYHSAPNYWIIFMHNPVDAKADPDREVQPLYTHPVAQQPQEPPPKGSLSHAVDDALVSHGMTLLSFESPADAVEFLLAAERKLAVDLEQPKPSGYQKVFKITGKLGNICSFRSYDVRKGDVVYSEPVMLEQEPRKPLTRTIWFCPECNTDRGKEPCPLGHSAALDGRCPMVGSAHGIGEGS